MKYLKYFENMEIDPFGEEDWDEKELYGMDFYLSEDQYPVYSSGEPFKAPWTGKNWVLIKKNNVYYIIGEMRFTNSDFFMFYSDFRSIENNNLKEYDDEIKRILNDVEKNLVVDELTKNFKMYRRFGNTEHYIDMINKFVNENMDVDPFGEEDWNENDIYGIKWKDYYLFKKDKNPSGKYATVNGKTIAFYFIPAIFRPLKSMGFPGNRLKRGINVQVLEDGEFRYVDRTFRTGESAQNYIEKWWESQNKEDYFDYLNENMDVDPFQEEDWDEKENKKMPFRSMYTIGETCPCGQEAYHKISEIIFDDDPLPHRHPYTMYVCDDCFQKIMRPRGIWNI
jgi:hypothetical protein